MFDSHSTISVIVTKNTSKPNRLKYNKWIAYWFPFQVVFIIVFKNLFILNVYLFPHSYGIHRFDILFVMVFGTSPHDVGSVSDEELLGSSNVNDSRTQCSRGLPLFWNALVQLDD